MSNRRHTDSGKTRPAGAEIHVDASSTPQSRARTDDWVAYADALPQSLQPIAALAIGVFKACEPLFRGLWGAGRSMGHAGMYFAAAVAPLVLWAASKWIKWYIMSYIKKAQRILSWAVWLIGLLPKDPGNATGAA